MASSLTTTTTTETTTTTTTTMLPSNYDLVQKRMAAAQAQKAARARSNQQLAQRNLQLKRLLHTNSSRQEGQQQSIPLQNGSNTVDTSTTKDESDGTLLLYAIKVSVCDELRQELRLSGREKRGRVFIEPTSTATRSMAALQAELHAFFRALRKGTYTLTAGYPQVEPDGTILVPATAQDDANTTAPPPPVLWPIRTDDDVVRTFQMAKQFYASRTDTMKRPAFILYVQRDPNAPSRPPPPVWLQDMPLPEQSPTITMLSFYSFPPGGIDDPDEFATQLKRLWKPFQALGRVYVAQEGINAQMSVPTNVLDRFMDCCRQGLGTVGQYMENGINIDPVPLTREEFAVAGAPAAGRVGDRADNVNNSNETDSEDDSTATATVGQPPFKNLHVRVRRQVVADGLNKALDWQKAGYDMPPLEWHQQLKQAFIKHSSNTTEQEQAKENESASNRHQPILLDCRNNYETDIGRFEGAEPLDTVNFRESWDVLHRRLADTPKDTPIFTYCTGGIRCVKVGAYLTQEMGFQNVNRLAGGIIAYDRTLQEQAPEEESLFKGSNFVFDGRLGRPITEDSMGKCFTCGAETSLVSNCRNNNCHKRIIQCHNCITAYHGTCSDACRNRVVYGSASSSAAAVGKHILPPTTTTTVLNRKESNSFIKAVPNTITEYSETFSTAIPSIYSEIDKNTRALIPTGSHMVSGSSMGRLLMQMASMTRFGRVLEVGTFTGYATVSLLEGVVKAAEALHLPDDSNSNSSSTTTGLRNGPYLLSMERDVRAFDVAVAHVKSIIEHGFEGQEVVKALSALREPSAAARTTKSPTLEKQSNVVSFSYQQGAAAGNNSVQVTCDLMHVSDALASMEEMAAGNAGPMQPSAPFDLVFLDADKTRLLDYANACLSSDRILRRGGMMIVDNVLWKGLVLDAVEVGGSGGPSTLATMRAEEDDGDSMSSQGSHNNENGDHHSGYERGSGDDDHEHFAEREELKKNRRARKLAQKMHRFNSQIVLDDRVEVLVLPVRDGLSILRKK